MGKGVNFEEKEKGLSCMFLYTKGEGFAWCQAFGDIPSINLGRGVGLKSSSPHNRVLYFKLHVKVYSMPFLASLSPKLWRGGF